MENEYSELFKKNLDRDDWNCFYMGYKNPTKLLKLVPNNPLGFFDKNLPIPTDEEFLKSLKQANVNMEKNEIKKALYKYNPKAYMQYIRKGKAYYYCEIPISEFPDSQRRTDTQSSLVHFEVPVTDMEEEDFYSEMDAKLLIRWIV